MAMPLYQARGAGTGGRRATVQDAGGGEGQIAIAEGISNLNQVGARITDAVYTTRAARGLAQAASRIDSAIADLDAEADRDPAIDGERYQLEYEKRLADIRDEEGEDLPAQYRDVYDEKLGLYGERGRLALTAQVQKKQINQSKAYLVETLQHWASEESRARTPAEKQQARTNMAGLVGRARALGLLDDAEMFKLTNTYQEDVWTAALNEGLSGDAADLGMLELRIGQRDGPFADMPEDKRQAALLAVVRRREAMERAEEIRQRFEVNRDRADARYEAKGAITGIMLKAVDPDPNVRVEPEDLALVTPMLANQPDLLAMLGRLVESGGRFPAGPPDKDYYGQLQSLRVRDPAAYAALEIGPSAPGQATALDLDKLGNLREEELHAWRTANEKPVEQVGTHDAETDDRWYRLQYHLENAPFYRFDLPDDLTNHELDQALGDYWMRVRRAQRDFATAHGGKDADGEDFTRLLDGVVLDLAEKYHDDRLRGEVDLGRRPAQATTTTTTLPAPPVVPRGTIGPLEGIEPGTVDVLRRSLQKRGLDDSDESVAKAYEAAVAAGRIQP